MMVVRLSFGELSMYSFTPVSHNFFLVFPFCGRRTDKNHLAAAERRIELCKARAGVGERQRERKRKKNSSLGLID